MQTITHRLVGVAVVCACLVGLAGCGRSAPKPADLDQARAALRLALDAWQNGDKAETLLDKNPAIRVLDREWQTGSRLVGYKVERDDPFAAELRCAVVLTVQHRGKSAKQKRAIYAVGTSPAITVVREEDP